MNADVKKMIQKLKTAQGKFQQVMKKQDWIEDARKYAEQQGKEVKKLLSSDLDKVMSFVERERKELERFQKQIPGEVKKFGALLDKQRKEFEKILKGLNQAKPAKKKSSGAKAKKTTSKGASKSAGTKKASAPTHG